MSLFTRHLLVLAALLSGAVSLSAQAFYFGNDKWEINDPFGKDPPNSRKGTVKGSQVTMIKVIGPSAAQVSKRLGEVTAIEWGALPAAMEEAETEVQRGEASKALSLIEPVVQFFAPLKKVPGSLWLQAASIKLDALVLLKNDTVIEGFIRELEEMNNGTIPGLDNRIRMAKLEQTLRKGNAALALADADKYIRDTVDTGLIANLHLIKGEALLQLRRYEEAMNAFLRVPVFYGSQTKYIPAAQLGAARAFRGMDSPASKHLRLEAVANGYLADIIEQYPLSKESEVARGMLPKDVRDALAKKEEAGMAAAKAAGEGATTETGSDGSAGAGPAPESGTGAAGSADEPATE